MLRDAGLVPKLESMGKIPFTEYCNWSRFRFRCIYLVILQTQETELLRPNLVAVAEATWIKIKYTVYMYVKIIVIIKSIS